MKAIEFNITFNLVGILIFIREPNYPLPGQT